MSGSIVSPTEGDVIVLVTDCYSSMSSHFSFLVTCFALAGRPWSQRPGACLRPWSRVCMIYTHLIRARWSLSLMARAHWQYYAGLLHWLYHDYHHLMHISCSFHVCARTYIMLFLSFHYPFFVHLLDRIWDPGFACPYLDLMTTPSEEDQEYLDGLAEKL